MKNGLDLSRDRARKKWRWSVVTAAAPPSIARWNVYCGAQPKTRTRSERCEGGCRSDAELREVGTEVIRIIARSSPKATVGSGGQDRKGHRDQLHRFGGAGRPMPFARVSPTDRTPPLATLSETGISNERSNDRTSGARARHLCAAACAGRPCGAADLQEAGARACCSQTHGRPALARLRALPILIMRNGPAAHRAAADTRILAKPPRRGQRRSGLGTCDHHARKKGLASARPCRTRVPKQTNRALRCYLYQQRRAHSGAFCATVRIAGPHHSLTAGDYKR